MLKEVKKEHIYIVCGHTDMRKSIDGLAAIVQCQFSLDLYTDSLFLFCGKRRDRMKALLWDGDGFLLLYKRLDGGKFIWLMQGLSVDQPKAIRKSTERKNLY